VGRGCVCRVAWQFVLVAMAQRVEVGRAGGGVLRPAAFIALRSRSGRVVVDAKDPVDMARLLMAWTGLGSDVALICSFEHRRQATSWGTGPLPALPEWASRTCVPEGRAAVVRIGDAPPRTSVFALLRGVGGHLAVVDDASMVVKLVNTISDLNGECSGPLDAVDARLRVVVAGPSGAAVAAVVLFRGVVGESGRGGGRRHLGDRRRRHRAFGR